MENKSNKKKPDVADSAMEQILFLIGSAFMGYFVMSHRLLQRQIRKDNFILKRHSKKKRFIYLSIGTSFLLLSYYVTPQLAAFSRYFYGIYLIIFPVFAWLILFFFAEEIFLSEINFKISAKNIKEKPSNMKSLERILEDRS